MQTIVERAQADLQRAEEAVTRALQERELCRAIVQRIKAYADDSTDLGGGNGHAGSPNGMTVAGAIEGVLQEADRPLLVEEILDRLSANGRKIGGGKPKANIASVLSRSKNKFAYQKGRGWSLQPGAPAAGGNG